MGAAAAGDISTGRGGSGRAPPRRAEGPPRSGAGPGGWGSGTEAPEPAGPAGRCRCRLGAARCCGATGPAPPAAPPTARHEDHPPPRPAPRRRCLKVDAAGGGVRSVRSARCSALRSPRLATWLSVLLQPASAGPGFVPVWDVPAGHYASGSAILPGHQHSCVARSQGCSGCWSIKRG